MGLYQSLFGKKNAPLDGSVIDMSEHGRVGGVSTGQPFKFVSVVDQTTGDPNPLPTGAATSAKQLPDNHQVTVSNMIPAVETGLSTATNQTSQITLETTLNSLTETLQELVQRLAPLAGAMAPTAQLRVTQTAVPSTAVTGPITSAQSIAEKNLGGVMYTTRVATENLNAVQSNINNCVVT